MNASEDFTPGLSLPYLLSGQMQKHVTMNESLRTLDALVQASVVSASFTSPPANPAPNDRYIAASPASENWAGHDGKLLAFQDGEWIAYTPKRGWQVRVEETGETLAFDGTDWLAAHARTLQNLDAVGLGTVADVANPFAASLNSALWTARERADSGTGDLRYTLNKETGADVLSLLFQSGYSGRAEIGLVGDENLRLRTSPDGATFTDALVASSVDGRLEVPTGISRGGHALVEVETGTRTLAVPGDYLGLQQALDALGNVAFAGAGRAIIELAVGDYTLAAPLLTTHAQANRITLRGPAVSLPAQPDFTGVAAEDLAMLTTRFPARLTCTGGALLTCGLNVENLLFTHSGTATGIASGGAETALTLTACAFHGFGFGAQLEAQNRLTATGLVLSHCSQMGIQARHRTHVSLTDSLVGSAGSYGLNTENHSSLQLRGSHVFGGASYALVAAYGSSVAASYSTFTDNQALAIWLIASSGNLFYCDWSGNGGQALLAQASFCWTIDAGMDVADDANQRTFLVQHNSTHFAGGAHSGGPVFVPAVGAGAGPSGSYTI